MSERVEVAAALLADLGTLPEGAVTDTGIDWVKVGEVAHLLSRGERLMVSVAAVIADGPFAWQRRAYLGELFAFLDDENFTRCIRALRMARPGRSEPTP